MTVFVTYACLDVRQEGNQTAMIGGAAMNSTSTPLSPIFLAVRSLGLAAILLLAGCANNNGIFADSSAGSPKWFNSAEPDTEESVVISRDPKLLANGSEVEWVQAFGQHKGSGDWFLLCAYQRRSATLADDDGGERLPQRPAWWVQELGAADAAFLRIDTDRQGHVPVDMLAALIHQLTAEGGADVTATSTIAEGFDADELEAAKRALDTADSGIITRSRFCAFWGAD